MYKPNISSYTFIAILVVLNLFLALYATPIHDLADTNAYITLSKTLLGEVNHVDLQHRSPLYAIIMAGFMLIFKAPALYKVMVLFQYILVAVSVWLVYLIFRRLFHRKELAMLVALLFNLSFSTIYYANIILTEILSVFLLILSVYLLLRTSDNGRLTRIMALGGLFGLLSLARFNTIPLIVTFIVLLGYILFRQKVSIKKWIFLMGAFSLAYALTINSWCLYNYQHHQAYRLFPGASIGVIGTPRNITIASIRPGIIVSEKNKPVLEIFLRAREKFHSRKKAVLKGSFAFLDKNDILSGLYSGYPIFLLAIPQLKAHYNLSGNTNPSEITSKIDGFLKEIAAQRNKYIWKTRIYSLLSGFRASTGGSLPLKYGNVNLNFLPSSIFMTYKLSFLLICTIVFISFFFFIINTIKKNFVPDITLLVLFFIVFSFWGINFVFFTVGDANRFKFPAEPLIIGLFVFYSAKLFGWLKTKKLKLRRKNHAESI